VVGSRAESADDLAGGAGATWFTVRVLEFSLGMVIFFALAIVVTDMRDEGGPARTFMVVMTVVFSFVLFLQLLML